MHERLINRDPLRRVQHQHFLQQVFPLEALALAFFGYWPSDISEKVFCWMYSCYHDRLKATNSFSEVFWEPTPVCTWKQQTKHRRLGIHYLFSFRQFVDFFVKEIALLVKMIVTKHAFPDNLIRRFALQVHKVFQHLQAKDFSSIYLAKFTEFWPYLIVCLSRKQDFAGVQFINSTSRWPKINSVVVGNTQY